jgi:cell wall-associated NlpC family hydrolase
VKPDPRLTPARADLASLDLEGVVRAPRFVEPSPFQVAAPGVALRASQSDDAEQLDQMIFGERFDVLETRDGHVWGQARRDGYVGWAQASALSPVLTEATHRVTALRTFAFAGPSIKTAPFGPLSLNALVTITAREGELCFAEGAGWIAGSHLAPVGQDFVEPAALAERFLGTPYLWGGRGSVGLDCSALVQQALWAAGLACPRDSDQQQALGVAMDPEKLRRGDLVFWRGHVAMMLDGARLIHANAYHMAVAIEPLAEAVARISARDGGDPIAYRRPPPAAIDTL